MPAPRLQTAPPRLAAHLSDWLGWWPPATALHVVGADRRIQPGWDGQLHPALGVHAPATGAVLSVPPHAVQDVQRHADNGDLAAVLPQLPALLAAAGLPAMADRRTYRAVFRWSVAPAAGPDLGSWVAADLPEVPQWLRPFGGQVLIATDDAGRYAAGVGIKRHDRHGHELSVVTVPAARGRSLARALVAQAARRVLDEGGVPTYQHDPGNIASARVADAAGFPDLGWTSYGISDTDREAASPQRKRPSAEHDSH